MRAEQEIFRLKKFDGSKLDTAIAKAHTCMLVGIGIEWVGAALDLYWIIPFGFLMILLFGARLAPISTHRWTLLLAIGLAIPVVQWWCAYTLNEFANAFLKTRGIRVGMFGAYYPDWAVALVFAAVMALAYGIDRGLHVMGHAF